MGKAALADDEPVFRMSREEYRAWAERQPTGRFERVAGVVVAMAPERAAHNRRKRRAYEALDRGVRAAGLPCEFIHRRNHGRGRRQRLRTGCRHAFRRQASRRRRGSA